MTTTLLSEPFAETTTTLPSWAHVAYVPESVDPAAAVQWFREAAADVQIWAVDVETNALKLADPAYQVRTIQIGTPTHALILTGTDANHQAAARELLEAATLLTAHNAAFDTQALTHVGVFDSVDHGWAKMIDTMLLAKVIEPPSLMPKSMYDLKSQAATWLGEWAVSEDCKDALKDHFRRSKWKGLGIGFDAYKPDATFKGTLTEWSARNGWANVDPASSVMLAYAAADVLDGARLAEVLYGIVGPTDINARDEHRLARLCAGMEYRGLHLDREYAEEKRAEFQAAADTAATELTALGLSEPTKDAAVAAAFTAEGFPLSSGEESALVAAEAAGSKLARPLIEFRKASKLVSTYFGAYLRVPGDRVQTRINTFEARTGRMSATSPNLQNVPSGSGVRECFTAVPGHTLVSCDFSSVEMRVAAALTGDPTLRRLYAEGGDPYWLLARMAYGEGATREQRGQVKGFVLGRMYGGGVATLSRNQSWTEVQGQHLVEVLDDAFPFIKKLNYQLRDQVKRDPMWSNEFGRLQVCEKSSSHTVLNYRIQGLSRDLLAQAMFRVEDAGLVEYMLLPIHDELVCQFPDDRVDELTAKLQEAMYCQLPISPSAPVWNDRVALQQAADLPGFVEIPAEAAVLGKRWIAK